jgi:CheY-like chemotaxis protein
MNQILVAEDSLTQAIHIKHLLAAAGFGVETVANGVEALRAIERQAPDLLLTDLEMPEMNGLKLVEAVHRRFPRVPVVLMTAFGSDEVAARALEAGAASYVPKRNLEKDLLETIRDLLAVVAADRELARLSEFLTEQEARFDLGNDLAAVAPIVAHVKADMDEIQLVDEAERIRVGVALGAALRNAIFCGNLELSAACRNDATVTGGANSALDRLAAERAAQSPYRERNAWLEARLSRGEAVFVVGHEGAAYRHELFQIGDDATRLESDDDGWVLVKSFMDEVTLDAGGKLLTLTKRAAR